MLVIFYSRPRLFVQRLGFPPKLRYRLVRNVAISFRVLASILFFGLVIFSGYLVYVRGRMSSAPSINIVVYNDILACGGTYIQIPHITTKESTSSHCQSKHKIGSLEAGVVELRLSPRFTTVLLKASSSCLPPSSSVII